MAYYPVLNDLFKINVYCDTPSQIGIFGWWAKVDTVLNGGVNLDACAVQVDAVYSALVMALLSKNANYLGCKISVPYVTPQPMPSIVNNPQTGLVNADVMPTQVSGIITLQTNFVGQRNRGRCYVPFPGETDNDATGFPTAGYLVNLAALASQIVAPNTATSGISATGFIPVIFHRGTVSTTSIVGARANPRWATMKKRGAYGRTNAGVIT